MNRAYWLTLSALLLVPLARAQDDPARTDEKLQVERMELRGVRMDEALHLLGDIAGLNFVCTPDAARVQITALQLSDVSARAALEAICKTHDLWYRKDASIYRVMTAEEYQRDLTVVREPETRVYNLLHPNPVAVATTIRDLFGTRVLLAFAQDEGSPLSGFGGGLGGGFGNNGFGNGFNQGFGNNGLTDGSGNQGFFGSGASQFTSPLGGGFQTNLFGGYGGGFGQIPYGNNQYGQNGQYGFQLPGENNERLSRTLTPEQLGRLSEQDGKVKATEELEAVADQRPVIAVSVNRRHNLIVVRTSDQDALKEIDRLVLDLDRPLSEVLLEVKVLEVLLGDGFDSALDVDWVEDPPAANLPTGKPANPFLPGAGALEQMAVAGNFPIASGGALVYQFLNEHVRARIQLLGRENRLSTLATPLLLCANSEVARIFIGEERPLVRSFQVQTTATQGVVTNQVVPTVDLRDVGNSLRIVPRINADRTVTLTIIQDISSVNIGGANLPVSSGTGGVQTFPVDTVSTSNLQGTVVAKDGLTVAIGGLIRKSKSDRQEGLPWFQEIPLLGWLFGSTSRSMEHRELLILITPHVIMTPAEGHERTRARMRSLSIHPWHDSADRALRHYEPDEVPGSEGYRFLIEDYLCPIPGPGEGE